MCVSKIWFFTYNPYFELVGLSVGAYGFVFCGLNIVAFITSRYADHIERTLGEKSCVVVLILTMAIPLIVMGVVPILPCAYLVLAQNVVRGFMRPFVGDYLNRHVRDANVRATVLSVQSSGNHVAMIAGLFSFGFVVDVMPLTLLLCLLGLLAFIFGGWSVWTYTKINNKK